MTGTMGVTAMAGRIVIRMSREGDMRLAELSRDQVRPFVVALLEALEYVESGNSIAVDLASFIESFQPESC